MKRIQAGLIALSLLSGIAFGQAERFQLSLYGGMNRVLAYGSNKDYLQGINDFPAIPAHTPVLFGAAFAFSLTERLGLELRGEYAPAADMTLIDPSDQDAVTIPSGKHMSFSLNALWALGSGRFEPYLVAGGGIDKLSAKTTNAVTAHGYEVTFSPPARTLDFFINAGVGARWKFSSSLGLFLEARYRYLFANPNAIQSIAGGVGLRWKF